jgi:hypothetical protein
MLRYASRFNGKNRQKILPKKMFKKKFNFFFKKSTKKLCLNSYAFNRGSASENFGGLGPLV